MEDRADLIRVLRPRSLASLLRACARYPDALLFAGGTEIVPEAFQGKGRCLDLPDQVIYLGQVAELARISRLPRFLDVGAGLPINKILSIGRFLLPRILLEALSSIGGPSVRNLATLGGNICSPSGMGDTLPVLDCLEAQFELRSLEGPRWVRVGQFFRPPEGRNPRPGEVLVRVRVPLEEWDVQVFRKVVRRRSPSRGILTFAGLARLVKGRVDALRFAFGGLGPGVLRVAELEELFLGRKLPVGERELEEVLKDLESRLQPMETSFSTTRYRQQTALRLFRWFIASLSEGSG